MLATLTTWRRASYTECTPLAGDMATFALLAEFAPMHVIIIMAAITGLRDNDAIIHFFFMASIAIQFLMSAVQFEFGTRIVLKIPRLPGARVMTGLTFFPQAEFVYGVVILFVAGKTIRWGIFE